MDFSKNSVLPLAAGGWAGAAAAQSSQAAAHGQTARYEQRVITDVPGG
jgi:hypothetical protein